MRVPRYAGRDGVRDARPAGGARRLQSFTGAANEQSVLLGQPDLRRVLVAHPIQDRSDGELRVLARDALDALLAAVTGGSGPAIAG